MVAATLPPGKICRPWNVTARLDPSAVRSVALCDSAPRAAAALPPVATAPTVAPMTIGAGFGIVGPDSNSGGTWWTELTRPGTPLSRP